MHGIRSEVCTESDATLFDQLTGSNGSLLSVSIGEA